MSATDAPRADNRAATSGYYGMPVINPPVWEEREIAGYLFLGGLAGGSSILAAAGELSGRPRLAQRARLTASTAISLSLYALIKDLGRPARFLNMMRVVKPSSPMNIGTWILFFYAPANLAASATGMVPGRPVTNRLSTITAGALGSLVATYTGALISDTAVPAWHEGHREMPFLFASSAAMAAGGMGLVLSPRSESSPAWRLALLGAAGELLTERLLERRLGRTARALHEGKADARLRGAKLLAAGGVVLAAAGGRRHRLAAAVAGGALVSASALLRFGLFAAGMESARDPRYTIESQRSDESGG